MPLEQKETKEFIVYTINIVRNTFLFVLGAYFIWFFLYEKQTVSTNIANWGAFGDYFGGIMNPMVACAALFLLAKSLRIQHRELSETRRALTDASTAQKEHAEVAARQSQIDTNKMALEFFQVELQAALSYRASLTQLANEKINGISGNVINLHGEKVSITSEFLEVEQKIQGLREQHLQTVQVTEKLLVRPK